MFELILLIFIVIFFSGIFSGTEAAMLSVTPSEVEVLLQNKLRFSRTLVYIQKHINRAVTAILILNNIVNIAGSILVGQTAIHIFGSAALGIITTAFTFGIIIFSEIIPKSLATRYARTIARLTSPAVAGAMWFFVPIIFPVEQIVKRMGKGERTIGTEAQIRSLVRIGRRSGHIEQDEGQLIHRVFNLNDVTAADIMTPRDEISVVPCELSVTEAADIMIANPHSRFPIYKDSIDTIEGIVLETEILSAMIKGNPKEPILTFAREALFVDEKMKADDLLIRFRDEKTHMAIVRRKGKQTLGIVTLEDVLEELVGEIEDERDAEI